MDPTQNPAILLLSAFLPLVIALIKQKGFPTTVNALIAFAGYIIFGVIGAFMSGETLSAETLLSFVTTVTVVGTVAYNLIWSNLGQGAATTSRTSLDQQITDSTSVVR